MFAATMQQQQQMPEDDGRKARRKSPMSELADRLVYQLRNAEFQPTQEELDAVVKCKNEVVVSSIKYPLFFGVFAGCVSYRLKVLTRAFNIAVASAFGLEYGRRKAEYSCIKHFISLEHSPIKTALVQILQKDFPDHPLLQEVAQWDSSRGPAEEASEVRFPSDRKDGFPRGLSTLSERPAEYGPDDHPPGDRSRHMINRRELRTREPEKSEAVVDATDVLVDPLSLVVWSEGDESASPQETQQGPMRREWRRSHMTREQKREHMNRLRERRRKEEEQQQQQGHLHSMS